MGDIDRALQVIPDQLLIPRDQVERALQTAAWLFRNTRGRKGRVAPSTAVRYWEGLYSKIEETRSGLAELIAKDVRLYADWTSAAGEIAAQGAKFEPPHVEAKSISVPPVPGTEGALQILQGPIDSALNEAIKSLEWLAHVTRRADQRATAQKMLAGGPRRNEADHSFVLALASIFEDACGQKPDRPTHFDQNEEWRGLFLDFADPIFGRIDNRGRAALAGLIRRAIFEEKDVTLRQKQRRVL